MYEPNRGLVDRIDGLRFDVVGAAIGLVLAALMFPLRFLSSQIYIETLPIVLGLGCAIYLLATRQSLSTDERPQFGAGFARLAPALVFFGLAGMVVVAGTAGRRTLLFYDLGGVIGTLLLAQVVLIRERDFYPGVVLAQVILLGIVVRFAALYTAPGYIGIDIWSHMTYVEAIAQGNSLSAIEHTKYYASPFYHLLVVTSSRLLDVSLRNGLYLSLGIAMPLSVLLVYAAGRTLVSARWAVFAAAAYVVSDHAIRWGIHIIPTSMGLVFFLAILFQLSHILQNEHRPRDYGLLALFSAAVILTHQISSFIMLVFVGAGLLAQLLLRSDLIRKPSSNNWLLQSVPKPANLLGILIFDVGLITFMWSLTPYNGDTFLETVLSYLYDTLFSTAGFLNGVDNDRGGGAAAAGGDGGSQFIAELAVYMDTVGFLLLLFTTVIGSLVVLRRRRANHATFTLVITVVVMLFFVLGLPLFNVNNFVPGRWFAFLYAPMVILTAIGLRYLSRNLSPKAVLVCLLIFALVFPSVMLMSSDGTPDSPVFPSQNERLSYTDTELTAVQTTGAIAATEGQPLYTDHPYATVFVRTETHPAEVIRLRNGRAVLDGTTVYRTYQSDGGSFFRIGEGAGIRNPDRSNICPGATNHVYANGDVQVCQAP
ncbi:hypothetical protein [Halobellus captivus]|uniref:hypothetical protein n=1 Tax=Halobellus captivus TaxID=2592614 RepID=UPI00193A442B|nr:hypothetical protein [Halobellus captivus]